MYIRVIMSSNSTTIGSLPRSPSTVESLIATVVACTVLSIATFAIFVCLRKRYRRFYMPLCYDPKYFLKSLQFNSLVPKINLKN